MQHVCTYSKSLDLTFCHPLPHTAPNVCSCPTPYEGQMSAALFIDLRKAFDTVPHHALILKLRRFGIKDASLKWFTNYLLKRTQAVCIGNDLSSFMKVEYRTVVYSVLSFLLCISMIWNPVFNSLK